MYVFAASYIMTGTPLMPWRVDHSTGQLKQGFWIFGDLSSCFLFRFDRGSLNMFATIFGDLDSVKGRRTVFNLALGGDSAPSVDMPTGVIRKF